MVIKIDRDGPIPPSQQLANHLRELILSGELPAGRRIPSLTELEAETGLARVTIQKATQVLKDEGLVESFPGMGMFVVDRRG